MAVDGRKLRDTLGLGSDVFNEHPCSPCAKDNRNMEAIKYCVDCDENICGKCESDHKSTCQGLQYIPNIAKGIGTSKQLKDLVVELADLQKKIASLKLQRQDNIKQLQQDKDMILKEITALRKKINDHLDKMQKRLLEEVDILFDQRFKDTVTATRKVEDIESKEDTIQKNLKDARNVSEAELFVQFKGSSAHVKQNAKVLKELGITVDKKAIQFFTSNEMERFMSESTSFAHFSYCMRPKSAVHLGSFDVSLTSDKNTCFITGVCILENGDIVMADYGNKRLKNLSNTFTVTKHIDLPDNPYGICVVDSQKLAVNLINTKKVQFVTLKVMKLGKSFTVGDRCRDIVRHDSSLYVVVVEAK